MDDKYLPLEFQKLQKIKKENKVYKKQLFYVASDFYHTNSHKPESFYKPISKTFTFED